MVGTWDIQVSLDSMPEKVATAFDMLKVQFTGAEYNLIAYLGSQQVNGTNHAVLAEQLLTTGKDAKNVVLLIFNEKDMGCTLANIERVVTSGPEFGEVELNIEKGDAINETARTLFNATFARYCGSKVTPIALLGTQVTKGTNYLFVCEVAPALPGSTKIKLVTLSDTGVVPSFIDLLNSGVKNIADNAVHNQVKLSSPWVLFYKEVYTLFSKDSEVTVLFNAEEPELKIQVVGNDTKAVALTRFMPSKQYFGNVVLNISVVGNDGQPVPDVNMDDRTAIEELFEGNAAVSYIRNVTNFVGDIITYVVFVREVAQYYSDDISDMFGVTSTLYQYLAEDIFLDTIGQNCICFFSTDIDEGSEVIGSPLGEWP